jgi:hypothetical protein
MPSFLDTLLGRDKNVPEIPDCPDHHVDMRLRGKLGRPSRFQDQTESEYTFIYFCPVPGCNQTEARTHRRTQIPVPDAAPKRPIFSRTRDVRGA